MSLQPQTRLFYHISCRFFRWSLLLILPFVLFDVSYASDNLVLNSGFENGQNGQVSNWVTTGTVSWVSDETHTGNRALQLGLVGVSSASVSSNLFAVSPHAKLQLSAWLKANFSVDPAQPAYNLGLYVSYFAADRAALLSRQAVTTTGGSFPWKKLNTTAIVPVNAAYARFEIQLTNANGAVWLDDVDVTMLPVPPIQPEVVGTPVILPQPWQMSLSHERYPIGLVGILNLVGDDRLGADLEATLTRLNIPYQLLNNAQETRNFTTILFVGDASTPIFVAHFQSQFTPLRWDDLAEQGYMLSIVGDDSRRIIYLGGNSEQGRFYGLQALKQLIAPGTNELYTANIIDKPTLRHRGVVVQAPWYSTDRQELFNRLAVGRFNQVWIEGTYLNRKFWDGWREPLTHDERADIAAFVALASQNFVTPTFVLTPKVTQNEAPPIIFSHEASVIAVVDKFGDLYDLGVRQFGLSFNNLAPQQPDQLSSTDAAFFAGNQAEAHRFFANEVYQQLQANYAEAQLMIEPLRPDHLGNKGDFDEAYWQTLGQLPPEVQFISQSVFWEDVVAANRLTQRTQFIQDPYWVAHYGQPAPEFVVPLDRPTEFDNALIAGYTFVPLWPSIEDAGLVSWLTAADYAWAPERYNPVSTFEQAVGRYLRPPLTDLGPFLQTPILTPNGGLLFEPQVVTIDTTDPDVTIHYTLDGTMPTLASPQYLQPLTLSGVAALRLKARAFRPDFGESGVVSAVFDFAKPEAQPESIEPTESTDPATSTNPEPQTASEPALAENLPLTEGSIGFSDEAAPSEVPTEQLFGLEVESWRLFACLLGILALMVGAGVYLINRAEPEIIVLKDNKALLTTSPPTTQSDFARPKETNLAEETVGPNADPAEPFTRQPVFIAEAIDPGAQTDEEDLFADDLAETPGPIAPSVLKDPTVIFALSLIVAVSYGLGLVLGELIVIELSFAVLRTIWLGILICLWISAILVFVMHRRQKIQKQ